MLYSDHAFSKTFCHSLTARCQANISAGHSFNLVAIPGVGVTFFLRHLAYATQHDSIAVNSYELHDYNKSALYSQLARKLGLRTTEGQVDLRAIADALKLRAAASKRVVLIFNRFDRLGPILDQAFFENLWFLREMSGGNLSMIFVTAAPVAELAYSGMQDLFRLVDETLYLRGYTSAELCEMMQISGTQAIDEQALRLSGGHHALLQILIRCQNLENALSDPMVELLIKDLYLGMTPKRRKSIDAIANGRPKQVDLYLIDAGYVVVDGAKVRTFTPLLAEYASRQTRGHLPIREQRLLSILKRNTGHLVRKQDIFDAVWREANGIGSEWALNALVYRLRRNPAFDSQRYTIESYKKQGYLLIDHQA